MSKNNAEELQWILVNVLMIDNPTPMACASCQNQEDWQFFVELIYRLLKSDLVNLYPESILNGDKKEYKFNNIEDFCLELASVSPFGEWEEITSKRMAWIAPLIYITDFGKEIIQKFFSENFYVSNITVLNIDFIEYIEEIFYANNIEWSDKLLFPIKKLEHNT